MFKTLISRQDLALRKLWPPMKAYWQGGSGSERVISLPARTQQSLTGLIPSGGTWALRFRIPRWPLASGPEEPLQEHWGF